MPIVYLWQYPSFLDQKECGGDQAEYNFAVSCKVLGGTSVRQLVDELRGTPTALGLRPAISAAAVRCFR